MMPIDLAPRQTEFFSVARQLFNRITHLPITSRGFDINGTGIQVLVRQPGTENIIFFPVYSPSGSASFLAAEKANRSYFKGESASQNSANPEKIEFAGSVTVKFKEIELQASVDGLEWEENVAIAVFMLSCGLGLPPNIICDNVMKNGGRLPPAFFTGSHYLNDFLYN